MKPDGELTVLTYSAPAKAVIDMLADGEADPRLARYGRLTDACVSEGADGPVLELEFSLDRD